MKQGTSVSPLYLAGIVVLGLLLVLLSLALLRPPAPAGAEANRPAAASKASGHRELYQSSMHPWIVQDHPGSCPICGMELVKMSPEAQKQWEKEHPG